MVEAGLRNGIADGSVRADIDMDRAVNDFGAAVFGTAYQWIMQAYPHDMAQEMAHVRRRLISRLRRPVAKLSPLAGAIWAVILQYTLVAAMLRCLLISWVCAHNMNASRVTPDLTSARIT